MNSVACDLVHSLSKPGELDSAYPSGVAVVIFYAYQQQATVNGQRSQVLGYLSVVGTVAGRQLSLEVYPMRLVEQPTGSSLHHV
jgi:hypothetical protein